MTLAEIRDQAFYDVIPKDAELEVLADGFTFTEGPIWHPDDHYLIFSDIAESLQYIWLEGEGVDLFRCPSNQANGNCFGTDGMVISCEHATSQVVRHGHEGRIVTPIATHFEGKELNSPNDVVCDSKGRIWFTDPGFGRMREDLGILREQELDFQGVYRLDPDGALTCVVTDFKQPNGLCLSLDETELYVNDSADPCIRKFAIADDGSLTGGEIWARVDAEQEGRKWVPDGMKLANSGHLLCNGPNGVHIFDTQADCLGVIHMPEKSTNFCFGSPGRDYLYITASTRLYRIKTLVDGPSMIPGN
ncbi:MAG: SMP-30/gluconolactonase/LRE family protein [Pseudomonadota bacterium]